MTCAIVLYFDRPFDVADKAIGLTKAAELRMQACAPTEDIIVLVTSGFEHLTETAIARLAELKYRVVDASSELASACEKYPFTAHFRMWRGEKFNEACFFRWLVLEQFFGGAPILAMDSDIVWRTEPYPMLDLWRKGGGSFTCFGSPCLTFIRNASWYEGYREGLERLASSAAIGSEGQRSVDEGFTEIAHDQAFIKHLRQIGLVEDDRPNMLGHGLSERYFMTANPLSIAPSDATRLTFERRDGKEYIDGRQVPFWHMQTSFVRFLSLTLMVPVLTGKTFRVPFDPRKIDRIDNLALDTLLVLHQQLWRGDLSFRYPRYRYIRRLTHRDFVCEQFFNGGLAERIFTARLWWKENVWVETGEERSELDASDVTEWVAAASDSGDLSNLDQKLLELDRRLSQQHERATGMRQALATLGAKLQTERERSAMLKDAMAKLGAQLQTERERSAALKDAMAKLGVQLQTERERSAALKDAMARLGVQLQTERERLRTLREALVTATAQNGHSQTGSI